MTDLAETPSWRDITFEGEVPGGWGSRREQLLGFASVLDLEVALEDLPHPPKPGEERGG